MSTAQPTARPVELDADLYREIFAHSREAIAIIDPHGFYLQQNGAHFTLLGYSDEDLEGQTPALDLGANTFAEVTRQLAESDEYSGEIVCQTKRADELNVELTVFTMRSGLGEPLCLDAVRPAFEAKDIRVETNYQEGLRVMACDADRLQQVVWNLLSNASKFTPSGGTVGIRVSQDETHATIEISDTGPGIPPEFLPTCLKDFARQTARQREPTAVSDWASQLFVTWSSCTAGRSASKTPRQAQAQCLQ